MFCECFMHRFCLGGFLVSFLMMLGGCGDSKELHAAEEFSKMMVCRIPDGVVERDLLRDVDPRDQAKINLSVRAIEVLRRRNPERGWDFAGLDFFTSQTPILVAKGLMKNDRDKVESWIDLERQGKRQFNEPINRVVSDAVSTYMGICKDYVARVKWLDDVLAEAEKIDPELADDLLRSGKRVPCGISNVPKCKQ